MRALNVPRRMEFTCVSSTSAGELAGPVPQFSLGKSYPGIAPLGPALVTVDDLRHPDDLELGCRLGDEVLQLGRTRDLMFNVRELISQLSAVCPCCPATSSSPAPRRGSATPATRSGSSRRARY